MQPDTIIQNKEWHELTGAEIETLRALVSDEAEFRLLKKALLVSRENIRDIPLIGPGIKENLMNRFVQKTPVRAMNFSYWRKLAAAVILMAIGFGAYWIWKKNNNKAINHSIAKTPAPAVPQTRAPALKEWQTPKPPNRLLVPENRVAQRSTEKPNRQPAGLKNKRPFRKEVPVASVPVLVNTRVQADTLLLAFITEVY